MTNPVSEGLPLFRLEETEIEQHLLPFSSHTLKKDILKNLWNIYRFSIFQFSLVLVGVP